ncbi:hypothetical protein KPH14_000814 [Odynerus spinipes]|uniref:CCHC-type domain-containing protein n=1 Tax=Odynerus spinipes TaxID=1348599 RepID=A0AAD9VLF8_9HYME|nr:hypothetical protein KPH14_000814 [Odynerus spinipes]
MFANKGDLEAGNPAQEENVTEVNIAGPNTSNTYRGQPESHPSSPRGHLNVEYSPSHLTTFTCSCRLIATHRRSQVTFKPSLIKDSVSTLFKAFEQISLSNDYQKGNRSTERPVSGIQRRDFHPRPPRCFNCNQEGHYASTCPKPKREKGSCFSCGVSGHTFRDCPTTKDVPRKQGRAEPASTTTLIETPQNFVSAVGESVINLSGDQAKVPLEQTSCECCILITPEHEEHYYLEALINSGSAINIITERTYSTYFGESPLMREKDGTNYGGSYVKVTLSEKVTLEYFEPTSEILSIEYIEKKDALDGVRDNLDPSLPLKTRDTLFEILDDYTNSQGACLGASVMR